MASDLHGGTPPMISDAIAAWCDDVFRIYGEVLDSQRRLVVALIRSAAPVLDVGERAGEKAAVGAERLSATVQARREPAPSAEVERSEVERSGGDQGDVPRIPDTDLGGGVVASAALTDAAVGDTAVEDIGLEDVGLADTGAEDVGVGADGEDIGIGVGGEGVGVEGAAVEPVGGEVDAGDEEIADVLDGEELEVVDDLDTDSGNADSGNGDDRPDELVDVADVEAELGETDEPVPAGGAEEGEEAGVIDTVTDTETPAEPALDARPAGSKGSNGARASKSTNGSPRRRSPGAKRRTGSSA
ncbi:hypothetical protein ACFPK1_14805 [Actinomycetospora rhizophila]|uniref:Uncharacterized protein n=1 Tax=Actinomycetospora rhizophila TaxID=1416876 RepID=A0ABV9ZEG1_9PSEU